MQLFRFVLTSCHASLQTQSDSTSPFSQVPENRIYHARSNLAGEARSHLATLSEGGQGALATKVLLWPP